MAVYSRNTKLEMAKLKTTFVLTVLVFMCTDIESSSSEEQLFHIVHSVASHTTGWSMPVTAEEPWEKTLIICKLIGLETSQPPCFEL